MKLAFFIFLCLGLMALVIAEMYRDAEECKPNNFPGDGVSNAGDANSEMQAGTGETSVADSSALKPESSTVVNAPLPQSSPSARINYNAIGRQIPFKIRRGMNPGRED